LDDVFAINTLQVRFRAGLVPFFAVICNNPLGFDDVSMQFPGIDTVPLAFTNSATTVAWEAYVFVWSDNQADKDAAAAAAISNLPFPPIVVRGITSMKTSPPIPGTGYQLVLTDTENQYYPNTGAYEGCGGRVVVGYAELPAEIDETNFGVDGLSSWTGTLTWATP
jgi:hypothetical protein